MSVCVYVYTSIGWKGIEDVKKTKYVLYKILWERQWVRWGGG